MSTKTICDGCGKEIAGDDARPLAQVAIGPRVSRADACGIGCFAAAINSARDRLIADIAKSSDAWFKAHP